MGLCTKNEVHFPEPRVMGDPIIRLAMEACKRAFRLEEFSRIAGKRLSTMEIDIDGACKPKGI